MTKFLFCNDPYHGHVNPTMPIVRELVARGAEVIYYCEDEFKNSIQSTGAVFRPFKSAARSTVNLEATRDFSEMPLINGSHYDIRQVLDDARAEQADYLIYEAKCLWGRLLSKILKITAIRIHVLLPLNEFFKPFNPYNPLNKIPEHSSQISRSIDKFCRTYNLQPLDYDDFYLQPEPLNIAFMPREFHPLGEMFDKRFKFVGPSINPGHDASDFPFDSVLYISQGTVNNNIPAFYDICLTAFGNQPQQVVISIGDKVDRRIFGPLPDNIMMHSHVPQLDVLAHADIFITHGGMNGVMEALYFGVPMVVVPQTLEQYINAKRIEELRLGIVIENIRFVTAHTLRNAVAQLKDNLEVRANVQHMRDAILKAGGYKRAVDAIMQL